MSATANARLETFCDGVFAIALTLLIIEVRIPAGTVINTSADLWLALKHLMPAVFAFVLSFGIIFISWANHHEALKLSDKSSVPYIYANGLLLLGVVFVPFPTALLGQSLLTSHAAPAVVLYSATGVLMSLGWAAIGLTALGPEPLVRNARAAERVRSALTKAYGALVFYTLCTILAVWWPLPIAVVITIVWIYWVIFGVRTARESRAE